MCRACEIADFVQVGDRVDAPIPLGPPYNTGGLITTTDRTTQTVPFTPTEPAWNPKWLEALDIRLDQQFQDWTVKSPSEQSAEDIAAVCDELREFLLEKNRKYGDSALTPTRIFSRADLIEQIKVRIDDKLSRMKNRADDEDEDVEWDLLGYLILLRVARNRADREDV